MVREPVIAVVGEKRPIDERGSQRMVQEIAGDDGVKDLVERFDGGMIEMAKFQGERARENHGEQGPGQPRVHARSFQISWNVRFAGAGMSRTLVQPETNMGRERIQPVLCARAAKIEFLRRADETIDQRAFHAPGPDAINQSFEPAVQSLVGDVAAKIDEMPGDVDLDGAGFVTRAAQAAGLREDP